VVHASVSEEFGAERVREQVEQPRCRILAVVVGTIDQMLHGVVTGTDGLHASVRHWAQRGALSKLIDLLFDGGFEVSLTADHGNDPTTPSTDHSREAVPLLVAGPGVQAAALGERAFADVGATIADYFSVPAGGGRSFLGALR